LKKFKERNPHQTTDAKVKDLSKIIKSLPQYQKDMASISKLLNLAEQCMAKYKVQNQT